MKVHNALGPGLREKPYENALSFELRKQGFYVDQQPRIPIFYEDKEVGDCVPDIIVDDLVLIECKSIEAIGEAEVAQVLNYLRIAKKELGLILNFKPPKLEQRRVARTSDSTQMAADSRR